MNIKKIRPLNSQVVTTADQYDEAQTIGNSSIIDTHKMQGALKEYQKVIAVGPYVKNIKEGDLVMVDPRRYAKMKHQEGSLKDGIITDNPVIKYNIPMIELDHENYLLLQDIDISFVIEEYDEEDNALIVDTPPTIEIPKDNIIV